MPAIGLEALRAVFVRGDVRTGRVRDMVVIEEVNELAEFQFPASEAASEATPSIRSPSLTNP